jgi:tRNA (uracil-5-)-methyltransferase
MPLSAFEPERYPELLVRKTAAVRELLAPWSPPEPEIYPSPPVAFRMRAEFRIWHEGDALDYVMFRRDDPRTPERVDAFPIACERIQRLMPHLRERLRGNTQLRRRLFQVEFLSTLAGDTLVTLVYHRRLEQAWEASAGELADRLCEEGNLNELSLIGRSRGQKLVLGREFVQEVLPVAGESYRYRQYEQSFTQPNAAVNMRMLEWACARAADLGGDLLELFCGNGNFTLPLARHFDNVIATELSKSSIRAARENQQANRVGNVRMIRMAAAEVSQALRGERTFRRLAGLPRPLDGYRLDTLFVDPPRAGLDTQTLAMAATFPAVIYVSCNPQTLARDLRQLSQTHRVAHFALFDQFPYTEHMECGLLLLRR